MCSSDLCNQSTSFSLGWGKLVLEFCGNLPRSIGISYNPLHHILLCKTRRINILLINLFSLIINLDTRIFILDLFCHGGIYEASTKKESMHISKNFIFPPPQRLLKITRSRLLLTSINSCSIKSSQKGSITFFFLNVESLINDVSYGLILYVFLSSSIFSH